MINWSQLGTDFQQKYEGCYCRYTSPKTGKTGVFKVFQVDPSKSAPPRFTLFNEEVGDMYLTYTTEAELDFSLPETGYFQHERMALIFTRKYTRQWKKGLCDATGRISFPYNNIYHFLNDYHPYLLINEASVKPMFARPMTTLKDAETQLAQGEKVSIALSKRMALGLSDRKDIFWLWYDYIPVASVSEGKISVKEENFRQEIHDFIRDTGYSHTVV